MPFLLSVSLLAAGCPRPPGPAGPDLGPGPDGGVSPPADAGVPDAGTPEPLRAPLPEPDPEAEALLRMAGADAALTLSLRPTRWDAFRRALGASMPALVALGLPAEPAQALLGEADAGRALLRLAGLLAGAAELPEPPAAWDRSRPLVATLAGQPGGYLPALHSVLFTSLSGAEPAGLRGRLVVAAQDAEQLAEQLGRIAAAFGLRAPEPGDGRWVSAGGGLCAEIGFGARAAVLDWSAPCRPVRVARGQAERTPAWHLLAASRSFFACHLRAAELRELASAAALLALDAALRRVGAGERPLVEALGLAEASRLRALMAPEGLALADWGLELCADADGDLHAQAVGSLGETGLALCEAARQSPAALALGRAWEGARLELGFAPDAIGSSAGPPAGLDPDELAGGGCGRFCAAFLAAFRPGLALRLLAEPEEMRPSTERGAREALAALELGLLADRHVFARLDRVGRALIARAHLGARPAWAPLPDYALLGWQPGPAREPGEGERCLQQLGKRMRRAASEIAACSEAEREQRVQLAIDGTRDALTCALRDPETRALAGALRSARTLYRAGRLGMRLEQTRRIELLGRACALGDAQACEREKRARAEPELDLPQLEVPRGFGLPAYGLLQIVGVSAGGKVADADRLRAGQPAAVAADRGAPFGAVATALRHAAAAGDGEQARVMLVDPQGLPRLVTVWLDSGRSGPGRSGRVQISLVLEGLGLRLEGPGGSLDLLAPARCHSVTCWGLERLGELLKSAGVRAIDPRYSLRVHPDTPWENAAAVLMMLRELDAEVVLAH
ncbi:MAG: hypothetical protein JXR96_28930 [Deltaproteobacteria bacterium]|nr:hypothetical protein [Deltaproteobacteria bacterium]